MIRLQKHLRDLLGISRRKAEEYIADGKVTVNGHTAALGAKVEEGKDIVFLDGQKLECKEKSLVYIMLNKPKAYVTTRSDPQGRRTVFELLPNTMKHLFSVGRLDYNTEGLLLLTNDGDFSYRLMHPKFEVEKEYSVVINGHLEDRQIQAIEKGLKTEEITTSHAKVKIVEEDVRKTSLLLTIHEGQNREIRRMFESFGLRVLYLKRVRIQSLHLGNLASGKWRELSEKEIRELLQG